MRPTQDQMDRAREWINENYPDAPDAEIRYEEALEEIMAIDAATDQKEAGL